MKPEWNSRTTGGVEAPRSCMIKKQNILIFESRNPSGLFGGHRASETPVQGTRLDLDARETIPNTEVKGGSVPDITAVGNPAGNRESCQLARSKFSGILRKRS